MAHHAQEVTDEDEGASGAGRGVRLVAYPPRPTYLLIPATTSRNPQYAIPTHRTTTERIDHMTPTASTSASEHRADTIEQRLELRTLHHACQRNGGPVQSGIPYDSWWMTGDSPPRAATTKYIASWNVWNSRRTVLSLKPCDRS